MNNEIQKKIEDLENRVSILEKALASSSPKESGKKKKLSVREFLNEKTPRTDLDRILALAVYNEWYNEYSYFNIKDISDLIKKAKLKKPKNINDTVYKNVLKGYFEEDDEKGENGKKRWYVTETGISLVNNNFKHEEQGDGATSNSKPTTTSASPSRTRKSTSTSKSGNKKKISKVSAEPFDIHGSDNTYSLEDFIKEKNPGRSNAEKIVVIGYYISEILDANKFSEGQFSEGQVEYAYKMLKYKRPRHLRQIIINAKNEKDWFEPVDDNGMWSLTRTGDIFVSDELPRLNEET